MAFAYEPLNINIFKVLSWEGGGSKKKSTLCMLMDDPLFIIIICG